MFVVGGNSNSKQKNGGRQQISRLALSMYQEPPRVEVTLDQFEAYSIDRLHMLKTLEMQKLKGHAHAKEMEMKVEKSMNMYLPMRNESDKEKDELSHFILRMAFCQSEELRRWFLTHESLLFRYRLDKATREDKIYFMKSNGLVYEQVSVKNCLYM